MQTCSVFSKGISLDFSRFALTVEVGLDADSKEQVNGARHSYGRRNMHREHSLLVLELLQVLSRHPERIDNSETTGKVGCIRPGVADSAEVKLLILLAKLVPDGLSFRVRVAVPLLLNEDQVLGFRVHLQLGGRVSRLQNLGSEHVGHSLYLDDAQLLAFGGNDSVRALVRAKRRCAVQRLVAQRCNCVLATGVEKAEVRLVA